MGLELISLIFSNLGPSIRKEAPLILKEIASSVASRHNSLALSLGGSNPRYRSKMGFLNDDLTDLKNNILKKYDPLERLSPLLRWFRSNALLKGELEGPVLIPLELSFYELDLEELTKRIHPDYVEEEQEGAAMVEGFEETQQVTGGRLQQLAGALHMQTPTRRAVFFSLMEAEDSSDAFEKLTRLKLKKQEEREIVKVVLACALSEKTYNPYYEEVLEKFLRLHYSFRYSYQYTLWDYGKALARCSPRKLHNLAKLTASLLAHGALPLAVLRGLNFSTSAKDRLGTLQLMLGKMIFGHYFTSG